MTSRRGHFLSLWFFSLQKHIYSPNSRQSSLTNRKNANIFTIRPNDKLLHEINFFSNSYQTTTICKIFFRRKKKFLAFTSPRQQNFTTGGSLRNIWFHYVPHKVSKSSKRVESNLLFEISAQQPCWDFFLTLWQKISLSKKLEDYIVKRPRPSFFSPIILWKFKLMKSNNDKFKWKINCL